MKHKLFRTIIFCCAVAACACLTSIPSYAGGDPGMNGYNYSITSKSTNIPLISWTHVAVNKTSSPDVMSYAVVRQRTFTGTFIADVEINALTYKCGLSTEISFNNSKSVSTQAQYSIPANSSVTCRYGSAMLRTSGNMERWYYGRLMSSKGITEQYSYASYSDKFYN